MESDLQRAEYAAAAATSECLSLQEAAAGIAVADTRRQKMIAVRLAELKVGPERRLGGKRHLVVEGFNEKRPDNALIVSHLEVRGTPSRLF